jgi:predicted lysophospholipase L1 biosynthesis ABC-type transport system permease subunit
LKEKVRGGKMASIFSTVIAIFVIIPFLGYFISFIIAKEVMKNHRKAVHVAIDVTTFLLMVSVHFIVLAIWNTSYLWLIFLSVCCVGFIFAVLYWRSKGEIHYPKVLRGVWRINFLLFFAAYITLMITGLILRIIELN